MATASANTSAAHVVRGLPLVRHPARPTLCRRASRMGAPTGAAAHRPASTNCCTRMREDSFMLQAALVNTSAFETRLMKEGGMLHILRRHLAWKPSKRRLAAAGSHAVWRPYVKEETTQASYMRTLSLTGRLACAHTLWSVRKSARAAPILRATSESMRPSADKDAPRYKMDSFCLMSPPSRVRILSLQRQHKTSVLPRFNVSPYSRPTSDIHRMYSSATPPCVSTSNVSSAYTISPKHALCGCLPLRSCSSALASCMSTVMTMTNRNGESGHPWHTPACCGCKRDLAPASCTRNVLF